MKINPCFCISLQCGTKLCAYFDMIWSCLAIAYHGWLANQMYEKLRPQIEEDLSKAQEVYETYWPKAASILGTIFKKLGVFLLGCCLMKAANDKKASKVWCWWIITAVFFAIGWVQVGLSATTLNDAFLDVTSSPEFTYEFAFIVVDTFWVGYELLVVWFFKRELQQEQDNAVLIQNSQMAQIRGDETISQVPTYVGDVTQAPVASATADNAPAPAVSSNEP